MPHARVSLKPITMVSTQSPIHALHRAPPVVFWPRAPPLASPSTSTVTLPLVLLDYVHLFSLDRPNARNCFADRLCHEQFLIARAHAFGCSHMHVPRSIILEEPQVLNRHLFGGRYRQPTNDPHSLRTLTLTLKLQLTAHPC
jgi:hypothetical protein